MHWIRGPWRGRLAVFARPRGGDWLDDEISTWARSGVEAIVSLLTPEEANELELTTEAAHCHAKGMEFVSFPIPDRRVPASRSQALHLVKSVEAWLHAGKAVGIHCRQGIGRSGLIAACLLVSSGVTADAAFTRLTEARGLPIPETEEQRAWVDAFAPELLAQVLVSAHPGRPK
jgi:protein-tyrosine phosphatase